MCIDYSSFGKLFFRITLIIMKPFYNTDGPLQCPLAEEKCRRVRAIHDVFRVSFYVKIFVASRRYFDSAAITQSVVFSQKNNKVIMADRSIDQLKTEAAKLKKRGSYCCRSDR